MLCYAMLGYTMLCYAMLYYNVGTLRRDTALRLLPRGTAQHDVLRRRALQWSCGVVYRSVAHVVYEFCNDSMITSTSCSYYLQCKYEI